VTAGKDQIFLNVVTKISKNKCSSVYSTMQFVTPVGKSVWKQVRICMHSVTILACSLPFVELSWTT
jgi:hypothetical protein